MSAPLAWALETAQAVAEVLAGERQWALIHGENADVLPALPDRGVGHVITDPPYGDQTHEGARTLWGTGRRWRTPEMRERAKRIAIDFDPLADFDFVPEMLRTAQRWCLAFCELEQLGTYKVAAGEGWVRAAVWHRTDGTPQLSGDRPAQAAEGIAVMHSDAKKQWNGGGGRGLWSFGVERNDRHHPTQKPLSLMAELVRLFTDPGDVVLDPFAGSGTTGVACLQLGRRFIGIERSREHARVARTRLDGEARGLPPKAVLTSRAGQLPMFGGG